MSIQITSTTDSEETVKAAMGDLAQRNEGGNKSEESASTETSQGDETNPEESGISEKEGSEEEEASEDGSENTEGQDDSEEGSDSESKEGEEDENSENKKPKKKNGFKKRIDKLNRKISEREKELEYWRQEALKHQGKEGQDTSSEEEESAKSTEKASDRPQADDYDTHEEYVEALTDWKLEQKLSAKEKKEQESKAEQEFQQKLGTHRERVESFAQSHEDFYDVVEDVDDIELSQTVQEAIIESETGPQLMYELAKNRKELERINSLPATKAARELGKFENKVTQSSEPSKETSKKETKTSKAPEPIKPVSQKSGGQVHKSIHDENLSFKEYERLREKQLKERRA